MTTRYAKRNIRWELIKVFFLLFVFTGVFALIWLRTTVVNLEYEISELGKQKMELMREERFTSTEKANYYSVEKIEKNAIKRLGMSLPEREKIFFVKKVRGAAPYKVSIKSGLRDD